MSTESRDSSFSGDQRYSVDKLVSGLMPRVNDYPRPEWDAIEERLRGISPAPDDNAAWWAIARRWVDEICSVSGASYCSKRSANFLLGSSLEADLAEGFLSFAERARRRILASLSGLAMAGGFGPHVIFVFETEDEYYKYVAPYYPDGGHFGLSSGVHLGSGYGHFALPLREQELMEPVVAHELTHALLMHLPLPRWLNEGIATNIESSLCPRYARRLEAGWLERHRKWWDGLSVQEYWSGSAFSRPDKVSDLSYELAWMMVRMLAKDYERFRAFASEATWDDSGLAAAIRHLGGGLGQYFAAFLGEGNWEPVPEQWKTQSPQDRSNQRPLHE